MSTVMETIQDDTTQEAAVHAWQEDRMRLGMRGHLKKGHDLPKECPEKIRTSRSMTLWGGSEGGHIISLREDKVLGTDDIEVVEDETGQGVDRERPTDGSSPAHKKTNNDKKMRY